MNNFIKIFIVFGFVSVILGIASRISVTPFVVEASSFLEFAQFCFLVAITFLLYKSSDLYNK